MIDALIQAAQAEVDNNSIYVWGGSDTGAGLKRVFSDNIGVEQ